MRVNGNSLTESVYQLYQKNQSKPQETSFNDLLRAAAGDMQNATEPRIQIMADYRAWKSQQPERILPDSKGATEENLAYLIENFSGELSIFQRIEAVDTMREMGILTHNEMMIALGLAECCVVKAPDTAIICTGLAGDHNMEAWSSFFAWFPIMEMNDLDNLFKVVDRQLRCNRAEDVAEEIRAVLESVKQSV